MKALLKMKKDIYGYVLFIHNCFQLGTIKVDLVLIMEAKKDLREQYFELEALSDLEE